MIPARKEALWQTTAVADFSRTSLEQLLRGQIPAVRISDFASVEELRNFTEALFLLPARSQTVRDVIRIGISQYQEGVCRSKSAYFDAAASLKCHQQVLFQQSFDPVSRVCSYLRKISFDAAILQEPGFGEYYAGVGKERRGKTSLHVDFSRQDSAGWRVGEAEAQLAWNLYLNTPGDGALQVWDRQWTPDDEIYQSEYSFAYRDEVVAQAAMLEIPVVQGELIIFNSRNYHAVGDTTERIAYGSFISYFPDNELGLWS